MKKWTRLSIILSCISILLTIAINIDIARMWWHTDGKGRALFGLVQIQFAYEYYVLIVGVAALITGFTVRDRRGRLICCGLAVLAICLVFAQIWRLFIHI
jgi:hypothetical protein